MSTWVPGTIEEIVPSLSLLVESLGKLIAKAEHSKDDERFFGSVEVHASSMERILMELNDGEHWEETQPNPSDPVASPVTPPTVTTATVTEDPSATTTTAAAATATTTSAASSEETNKKAQHTALMERAKESLAAATPKYPAAPWNTPTPAPPPKSKTSSVDRDCDEAMRALMVLQKQPLMAPLPTAAGEPKVQEKKPALKPTPPPYPPPGLAKPSAAASTPYSDSAPIPAKKTVWWVDAAHQSKCKPTMKAPETEQQSTSSSSSAAAVAFETNTQTRPKPAKFIPNPNNPAEMRLRAMKDKHNEREQMRRARKMAKLEAEEKNKATATATAAANAEESAETG